MTMIQIPIRKRLGLIAILEWHENQSIMSRITNKPIDTIILYGIISHFINGTLAGIAYRIIIHIIYLPIPSILTGLIYGILLWIFTLALIHKPITGVSISNHPQGVTPILVSLLLHAIYGILLSIFR